MASCNSSAATKRAAARAASVRDGDADGSIPPSQDGGGTGTHLEGKVEDRAPATRERAEREHGLKWPAPLGEVGRTLRSAHWARRRVRTLDADLAVSERHRGALGRFSPAAQRGEDVTPRIGTEDPVNLKPVDQVVEDRLSITLEWRELRPLCQAVDHDRGTGGLHGVDDLPVAGGVILDRPDHIARTMRRATLGEKRN